MAGEQSNRQVDLRKFIEDLKKLEDLKNTRFKILGLQLYVEHYVNEIVLEQVKEPAKKEVKENLTFPQKIKILKNMEFVNNDSERILTILNKLRSILVHDLVISAEEINDKLKTAKLGFIHNLIFNKHENGKTSLVEKKVNLDEEYKKRGMSKYGQLEVSCCLLIADLHYKLLGLQGKKTQEIMDVVFKTDDAGNSVAEMLVHTRME